MLSQRPPCGDDMPREAICFCVGKRTLEPLTAAAPQTPEPCLDGHTIILLRKTDKLPPPRLILQAFKHPLATGISPRYPNQNKNGTRPGAIFVLVRVNTLATSAKCGLDLHRTQIKMDLQTLVCGVGARANYPHKQKEGHHTRWCPSFCGAGKRT